MSGETALLEEIGIRPTARRSTCAGNLKTTCTSSRSARRRS